MTAGTAGRRLNLSWLFVLPAVLFLAVFLVWPTLLAIRNSFMTGLGLTPDRFVGVRNYQILFTLDRTFLDLRGDFPPQGALVNNLIWLFVFVPVVMGLALLIAILADRVRYETIVKSIVFLPMGISFTAAAVIWTFVYQPSPAIGLLNAVLTALLPGRVTTAWLGRVDTVNYALIAAAVWMQAGFAMVILSAAIKGIPKELIEASRIDGATEWQVFRNITLPLLRTPLIVIFTALVIYVMKVFDLILIMTAGGPRGASRVIAYSYYVETFQSGKGGYGSAIAVVMLALALPVMIFQLRQIQQEGR